MRNNFLIKGVAIASAIIVSITTAQTALAGITFFTAPTPTGFVASPSACGNNWLNLSWNITPTIPGYEIMYTVSEGARAVYNGTSTAMSDVGLVLGSTHNYTIFASYFIPAVYDPIDGTEINPQNVAPLGAIASAPAFATGVVSNPCVTVTVIPNTYTTTLPSTSFTATYLASGGGLGPTCQLLDFVGNPLTAYSGCVASITSSAPAVPGVYAYSVRMKTGGALPTIVTSNTFTVTVNSAPPPPVTMTPDFTAQSGAPWSVTMTYNGAGLPNCEFTRTSVQYGNIPTASITSSPFTVTASLNDFIGPGTIVYSARCMSGLTWSPVVSTTVTILAPVPSLSVAPVPGSFDFVPLGGSKTITFLIENPTGEFGSMLVGNISLSDSHFTCTPAPCTYSVPVGGSQSFDVTYTPTVVGPDSGNLIFTDTTATSPHSWVVWGTGIIPVVALPPQVNFGPVPTVRSKDLTFTIKNISPVNLGSATFGGYDGVVFKCISPVAPSPDTCAANGINLSPNFDNIVTLRFTPSSVQPYHEVGTLSTLPGYDIAIDGIGVKPSFNLHEN